MAKPLKLRQLLCLWLGIASALVAADQLIKMLILDHFYYGQVLPMTSFFNLVRAHNTGAAFSMLADASGWQHWFFIAIALTVSGVIIFMMVKHATEKLMSFALACILGGAIGNLVDRLMHGYVVDYLDFHWKDMHFPAFNLADMAICLGAGLIILNEILLIRKNKKQSKHLL